MKFFSRLLLLLFVQSSVFAQKDSIPVYNIQDVIIYENRLQIPLSQKPSGVVVIDYERIDHSPVQSVADILHYVAGVDMRQRGANGIQNDVGIRGSSFDQVLILVNGIKISDPQTGHHSFNLPVDMSCVEHIEIYKGPSARVFGQNAFAGAINIITRNPTDKFINLQTLAGDFGLVGGGLSSSFSTGKIKNYISLSHDRSSGYKYNTDYRISDLFYQSEIKGRYGKINLLAAMSDRKFGANGFYSSPEFIDQYEAVRTSLVALTFSPDIKNRMIKLEHRLYWRRNSDEYLFIRDDPSYYRNLHINNIIGMDINLTYQNMLGVTGIGLDLSIPWITSNRLGNRMRKDATLFIDHRISLLNGKMNITPGLQVNIFSDFDNNILPGLDIGYTINSFIMAYVNSGYTYRVPTFTDLYYEDPVNSSNPDLQPEYACSNEAGLKTVRINGVTGQLSYFIRKNYNLIDRSKENSDDKWKPENIGEATLSGVDLNLNIQPDIIIGNKNFFLQQVDFGYTFINSSVVGDLPPFSKYEFENLRNQITSAIEFKFSRSIYQSVYLRYCDRVNLEDYTVADARLGWRSLKMNLYIDITNIFNVEYKETNLVTLPGRWIKAGMMYSFNLK
jgi:iron complex outermembrane receptor protein